MRESLLYGLTMLAVVAGLAVLLVGEATDGGEVFIVAGGMVVLLGVGGMTGLIAATEG